MIENPLTPSPSPSPAPQNKNTEQMTVSTLEELDHLLEQVHDAQVEYSTFTQEKVDAIFRAAAVAANRARIPLARDAVEETGRGILEDKVIKNHFASEYIYNHYKDWNTCDKMEENVSGGYAVLPEPVGVVAGIIPVTNPTSTAIFKALLCLKTRNGFVVSPHPSAKRCTIDALKIVLNAAVEAGAPRHIIGWIDVPSIQLSAALMEHPKIQLILATGGPGMVKAAYSSGKPALGVGAGNVPVVIDEYADVATAVSSIILSKNFDYGMICASEQSVIIVDSQYEEAKAEFVRRGAYLLTSAESEALGKIILGPGGAVNAKIVGHSPQAIGALAGITVPDDMKILLSEQTDYSAENPFAHEKLSPILTMYRAKDFEEAANMAVSLVKLGGLGHTACLHTNQAYREHIDTFSHMLPTGRVVINCPTSQGGLGDIYNFCATPSLTLGCGSWGGNSTSENVGVKHLLNYKVILERRENMLWMKLPPKVYFKRGALETALKELAGRKRAFLVTDDFLYKSGMTKVAEETMRSLNMDVQVFSDVLPDPTLSIVKVMLTKVRTFQPDVIVAIGGGSPMDAAKILWLMYEHPEVVFDDIATRFMDIRKRICSIPSLGEKAMMVCIPTTSGTGSEVTPFSVITDENSHIKFALADYALTPSMAIIDPDLVDNMPKGLTAAGGYDAMVHAIESYASTLATEFTQPYSMRAIQDILTYLPRAYKNGSKDLEAREHMHYTATIAGIAFANAFLGIGHSMAHKLGNAFDIPHGIACALCICQVIKFNANDRPKKQALFPQYKVPCAKERYATIARTLGLGNAKSTDDELVDAFIEVLQNLKRDVNIPLSIKEYGIKEEAFYAKLDEIVELAFDDQCTGANPVYPLMSELKELFIKAYNGTV